jgi:hypothetical protein
MCSVCCECATGMLWSTRVVLPTRLLALWLCLHCNMQTAGLKSVLSHPVKLLRLSRTTCNPTVRRYGWQSLLLMR